MRNTTSYLETKLHKLQQTNMLEHMMEIMGYDRKSITGYERYNNMKIYPDMVILFDIIDDGEAFLCSYENKVDNSVLVEPFFVLKGTNQTYHKVKIYCDNMQGIYKCGQWYTSISLKSWNVSQENFGIEKDELKKLINVVDIPLHQNEDMSPPLYEFVTETCLCRF